MPLETKEIFEFGKFRLDVGERSIECVDGTKNGALTEKSFQTLVLLIRRHGHLVSKDELIRFVWPDTIVEENNLEKCVHHLRQFLGESRGESSYIETVRKHGYRFVAEVRRVPVGYASGREVNGYEPIKAAVALAGSRPSEIGTNQQGTRANRSRLPIAIVSVILLGVVAFGYFVINRPIPIATGSIAVLPFTPINASNRDEQLEIGIADSLIHQLAVNGLVVRPLSSVRSYTEVGKDPLDAGRAQNVAYVLASTYQLADGRIRIRSQLVNVATGQVEKSYTFDNEAAGIFAIQDAVTDEIGNELVARFGGSSAGWAAKRETSSARAYDLYLQGRYFYDKRGSNNAQKSLEKLSEAVELDPGYALAWAGKAHAHLAVIISNKTDIAAEYQRSMDSINKALALDPDLSLAHSALCQNRANYEHDFAGAERECKRAIELDPNSPPAHQIYAYLLMESRRPDEAITEIKTAMGLDPASYLNKRSYPNLLYYAGRYDDAIVLYQQLIDMGDQSPSTYEWYIRTLEMQGKEFEAFELFIRSLTLQKKDDKTIRRFVAAYRRSGWPGVLRERDRTFNEADPNYFRRAGWNARSGNKDKAFEYLEKAFQLHQTAVASLAIEPLFDTLHDDPRFSELVKRVTGQ
jgi:DNA-binding winged helix-turn-helix (wHTH) protein/TolB-like protein/Tfp pilus assembly protein PilF